MRQTFPPPRNPMAALFRRAAESLTTSLTAHSAHYYQCTGRHFLNFLDAEHPRVRSLGQLRRDPHTARAQAHPGLVHLIALSPACSRQTDLLPLWHPCASPPCITGVD